MNESKNSKSNYLYCSYRNKIALFNNFSSLNHWYNESIMVQQKIGNYLGFYRKINNFENSSTQNLIPVLSA